jgi:hypothetical protein
MDPGILVPLGCFVAVVLIVAVVSTSKIRAVEVEVQRRLHSEELEHQQKMRELQLEWEKIKGKS